MNEFHNVDLEVAMFLGNPLNGGIELNAESYSRALISDIQVALYGSIWGIVNKEPVQFAKAKEQWPVSHIAIMARHYDMLLNCCPVTDLVAFADPVTSTLEIQEIKVIPPGHSVTFVPGSLFLAASIVVDLFDLDNQSKMIN